MLDNHLSRSRANCRLVFMLMLEQYVHLAPSPANPRLHPDLARSRPDASDVRLVAKDGYRLLLAPREEEKAEAR